MKKVILKARIRNLEEFEQKLEAVTASLSMPVWVHDRVFVPRNYEARKNWPRLILRTEMRATDRPPRYLLVMKRHIEDSDVDFVNEVEYFEYEEMAEIVLQMGFGMVKELGRQRQEVKWDEILVRVDRIAGENFVKLEAELLPVEKVGDVQKLLLERMKKLGVKREEILDEPYFEILK